MHKFCKFIFELSNRRDKIIFLHLSSLFHPKWVIALCFIWQTGSYCRRTMDAPMTHCAQMSASCMWNCEPLLPGIHITCIIWNNVLYETRMAMWQKFVMWTSYTKTYSETMVESFWMRVVSYETFPPSVNLNLIQGSYNWGGLSKTAGAERTAATWHSFRSCEQSLQCPVLTLTVQIRFEWELSYTRPFPPNVNLNLIQGSYNWGGGGGVLSNTTGADRMEVTCHSFRSCEQSPLCSVLTLTVQIQPPNWKKCRPKR